MEKIVAPLNIIANFMMANQISKIDHVQLVDNASDENNGHGRNQNEVVEHE